TTSGSTGSSAEGGLKVSVTARGICVTSSICHKSLRIGSHSSPHLDRDEQRRILLGHVHHNLIRPVVTGLAGGVPEQGYNPWPRMDTDELGC
ncbi:MAG: hypothetical protein NT090_18345, partial [Acidobacteria bacterium]|nr:hypothetical protein [Acidobacteriota bacterium]